ncbi:MAG: DUF2760 domain-containing protein [bacterium]|nr:DUF2760 domain-containing protein [bacterium]
MRLVLAFRAFFAALFSAQTASEIRLALEDKSETPPTPQPKSEPKKPVQPAKPTRSEAISLLAALQREARFLDIVKEPLADYSDAQIGAAARDVLRDCNTVLDRVFDLQPVAEQSEGESIETPENFDPACYKLTGNVAGEPPFRGELIHAGWRAGKCELPKWSGGDESAQIIAPVEIEIK